VVIVSGVTLSKKNLLPPSRTTRLLVFAPSASDVCGFDIAVDNASSVRRIQGVGNLDGEREYRIRIHRTVADAPRRFMTTIAAVALPASKGPMPSAGRA